MSAASIRIRGSQICYASRSKTVTRITTSVGCSSGLECWMPRRYDTRNLRLFSGKASDSSNNDNDTDPAENLRLLLKEYRIPESG
jgi:hypothetical protein